MDSQAVYNKLNRARIYLLTKRDYPAVCVLDTLIYSKFRKEEEQDFQSGESIHRVH